ASSTLTPVDAIPGRSVRHPAPGSGIARSSSKARSDGPAPLTHTGTPEAHSSSKTALTSGASRRRASWWSRSRRTPCGNPGCVVLGEAEIEQPVGDRDPRDAGGGGGAETPFERDAVQSVTRERGRGHAACVGGPLDRASDEIGAVGGELRGALALPGHGRLGVD